MPIEYVISDKFLDKDTLLSEASKLLIRLVQEEFIEVRDSRFAIETEEDKNSLLSLIKEGFIQEVEQKYDGNT